jgi:hypothetical protein
MNTISFCRYTTIKSENDFNAAVMAGISVTELLKVSNIPGRTNPNKYITATIEITINDAG